MIWFDINFRAFFGGCLLGRSNIKGVMFLLIWRLFEKWMGPRCQNVSIYDLFSIARRQLRSLLNKVSISFRGRLQSWPNHLIAIRIYFSCLFVVLFNDYLLFFTTISVSSFAISRPAPSSFVSNFQGYFLHRQTFVLNRNLCSSPWYWLRSQLVLQFLFVLFGETSSCLRFGSPLPFIVLYFTCGLSPCFLLSSLFFVAPSRSFFL